ncbi:MAG TPA: hypothetical protein VK907_10900 [Phnomibacter sp.]|nr:hypothetical protein [Phnomibacter sp.]
MVQPVEAEQHNYPAGICNKPGYTAIKMAGDLNIQVKGKMNY